VSNNFIMNLRNSDSQDWTPAEKVLTVSGRRFLAATGQKSEQESRGTVEQLKATTKQHRTGLRLCSPAVTCSTDLLLKNQIRAVCRSIAVSCSTGRMFGRDRPKIKAGEQWSS
jgi:hypothetical protein